jgi:hypothetical protein
VSQKGYASRIGARAGGLKQPRPFTLPLFTGVRGRGFLGTSHGPGPTQRGFLCRVSKVHSPAYLRN